MYTPEVRRLQAKGVYISKTHGISDIYHSRHTHLINERTTEHSSCFFYTSVSRGFNSEG